MKLKILRSITAWVLCLFITVSACSCNLGNDIRVNVEERMSVRSEVAAPELTRILISTINDKEMTAEAYSQIPEQQQDGLSYSYFYEYTNILRTVSNQRAKGKVTSFRIMDEDECRVILGQKLFDEYGRITGAELMYSSDPEYPVYIFYRIEDDGSVTLSKDWITSIININNYSNHYFTLLDESNADGVMALILPGIQSDIYTDDAVYARAAKLCEFYKMRVMSSIAEFEITMLTPDKMTVRIPETLGPDRTTFEEHVVTFSLKNDGNFYIDDKITDTPDLNLLYLVRGDERLLRVGTEYSYAQLLTVMGEPSSYSISESDDRITVLYPGVLLRFDGYLEEDDSWGTLTSIRTYGSSVYSIGYNLYSGISRTGILVLYPFANEVDQSISFFSGTRDYVVSFEFDDEGYSTSVKVSV